MKERPILFSGEMVKAILEGRKTQTRRLSGLEDVNEYPGKLSGISVLGPLGYKGLEPTDYNIKNKRDYAKNPGLYHWFLGEQKEKNEINPIPVKCPCGQLGDRLWVRETFACDEDDQFIVFYKATDHPSCGHPWQPSIFMPRWASRITLEVTNVRVERVRDISFEDCLSEGCSDKYEHYDANCKHEVNGECCQGWHYGQKWNFYYLWNSINAKRGYGWDVNPWVWVVEFKVLP